MGERALDKLEDCRAKMMIAEDRIRWYENAFSLIREVIRDVSKYDHDSCWDGLRDIEKR